MSAALFAALPLLSVEAFGCASTRSYACSAASSFPRLCSSTARMKSTSGAVAPLPTASAALRSRVAPATCPRSRSTAARVIRASTSLAPSFSRLAVRTASSSSLRARACCSRDRSYHATARSATTTASATPALRASSSTPTAIGPPRLGLPTTASYAATARITSGSSGSTPVPPPTGRILHRNGRGDEEEQMKRFDATLADRRPLPELSAERERVKEQVTNWRRLQQDPEHRSKDRRTLIARRAGRRDLAQLEAVDNDGVDTVVATGGLLITRKDLEGLDERRRGLLAELGLVASTAAGLRGG